MSRPLILAGLAVALVAHPPTPAAEPMPAARATLGSSAWRQGGSVAALAFTPDGKALASASYDAPVRLWEVATGRQRREFVGHERAVRQLGFSPDGRTLLSAGWQDVRLWEVASGLQRAKVGDPSVWIGPVAFSPDGKTAASRQNSRNDHRVRLSSIPGGQLLHLLEGHTNGVNYLTFSPDGKTLATGSADESIRLWEVATGKQTARWTGHDNGPTLLRFSPDGKHLASVGFGSLRVWDVAAGKNVANRVVHLLGSTQLLDFNPDGKTLALGGRGAMLWDWSADKIVRRFQGTEDVTAVAFSPDGLTLAIGPREGAIRLWQVKSGEEVTRASAGHQKPVTRLAWLPDGKTLATSSPDGTVRFWDIASNKELRTIAGLNDAGRAVAFSADGRFVAAIEGGNRVGVWDAATAKLLWAVPPAGPRGTPAALAFTADGKRLAVCGHDGPVRLFDTATHKELAPLVNSKTAVLPLAFSADGRYIAGFVNGQPTPALLLTYLSRKPRTLRISAPLLHVSQMIFSPDARTLAAFSEHGESSFRVFETATGQLRFAARGHLNGMYALAFSPEGRFAVSGGLDRTVAVHDLMLGAEIGRLSCPSAVTSLAWSPDGRVLAVGGADTRVRTYDRARVIPARPVITRGKLPDKMLDTLWADLGSPIGSKGYAAMRTLSAYSEQALPLLAERVPRLEVGTKIGRWIDELDSDDFATRARASEMLEENLAAAEGPLRKALGGKVSAEQRRRVQALLRQIKPGEERPKLPGEPALQIARAVEVLERLGSAAAKARLRAWAEAKPETALSRQAKEALQRLERALGRQGGKEGSGS